MKKINLLSFLIVLLITNNAIAQDHLDDITAKVCDEVKNISDTLTKEKYIVELGLKMMSAAGPYTKELKKKNGIDIGRPGHAEKLGELIGVKMAATCPDQLMEMANIMNGNVADKISEMEEQTEIEGEVTKVEEDKFIAFSVRDNFSGRVYKYYWLGPIETDLNLESNYQKMVKKKVGITFTMKEFYDPKIGDYRFFRIINSMEEFKGK